MSSDTMPTTANGSLHPLAPSKKATSGPPNPAPTPATLSTQPIALPHPAGGTTSAIIAMPMGAPVPARPLWFVIVVDPMLWPIFASIIISDSASHEELAIMLILLAAVPQVQRGGPRLFPRALEIRHAQNDIPERVE